MRPLLCASDRTFISPRTHVRPKTRNACPDPLATRGRMQVSQKQSFVARAKRDLHEAESMLARARKDAQMTETELQAQEASFGRRGESRAADAQAAVDGAAAAMRWKVVHDSMAATSVLSAALGSNNVTFVPPPVEIE